MSISEGKKNILEADINFDIGGVSTMQKALFAKHLALMLRSGIPISEALSIASSSSRGKMAAVLEKIRKSVESGRSLSAAFADFPGVFSDLFINVARIGEASGTLPENLEGISEQLKKERELISKIKTAMMYPVMVLSAAFVLGMVVSFAILPKITPLFEGLDIELPITTRILIAFSKIVQQNGIYLFVGIVLSVALGLWLIRRKFMHPVTHWVMLNTPIVKNISKSSNLARFSRTLGTLLKSGVPIDEALDIARSSAGNYYYKKALVKVSVNTKKGVKLWKNLSQFESLFPPLLIRMIRVGEKTGNFEETLFYLADYYEQEVDNSTKTLSTAIEPAMLLGIGLVVGFLALSIITPIYNITGNIGR